MYSTCTAVIFSSSLFNFVLRSKNIIVSCDVLGVRQEQGILLCGPGGTGKTMLVDALINELQINTLHITPANFYSQ
jgi:SpoVK/Ycf46/Vps4 family AAA+-type ATPase